MSPFKQLVNSDINTREAPGIRFQSENDRVAIDDATLKAFKEKRKQSQIIQITQGVLGNGDFISAYSVHTQTRADTPPLESVCINLIPFQGISEHTRFFRNRETGLSSSKPFRLWEDEELNVAINQLQELGISLNPSSLKKIYKLFKLFFGDLFEKKESYPLFFHAQVNEYNRKINIDLEIHTDRRVSLIFNNKASFIEEGGSKIVKLAFALGRPQLVAYTTSKPNRDPVFEIFQQKREQEMIIKFHKKSWAAKVHGITFGYFLNCGYPTQRIEMQYYPSDLHKDLENPRLCLSFKYKCKISTVLLQALSDMHAEGVVHLDIKPENLLTNDIGDIFLTDFALAHQLTDPSLKKHRAGTPNYMPPEILMNKEITNPVAIDSWGAGCTIWIIFFESVVPWLEDNGCFTDPSYIKAILEEMSDFEDDPSFYIPTDSFIEGFLIWSLLRNEPSNRLTATQALEILKNFTDRLDQPFEENLRLLKQLNPPNLLQYAMPFELDFFESNL